MTEVMACQPLAWDWTLHFVYEGLFSYIRNLRKAMRNTLLSFEEIRPYRKEEVQAVMARLSQKHSFKILLQYMFPNETLEELEQGMQTIQSAEDFQEKYISTAIWNMVKDSTEGLGFGGFEHLDLTQTYFFLSNHRDIILDSAFLNVLLHKNKIQTTQIAIGDNLLVSGLVTDLMKLNKSFIVHRNVARRDMIPYSRRLSAYIQETLSHHSIWMAQASGRAKDGNDKTNPALLKMLYLEAKGKGIADCFCRLNLLPMAVSYEFEPCDMLKAEELVHKSLGLPYEKDDKMAMIRGIRDPKGRVHLEIGNPVKNQILELQEDVRVNDFLKQLAALLDREIYALYKLWPNNYVAYDLMHEGRLFAEKYTKAEEERFLDYMHEKLKGIKGPPKLLREHFLQIYATPVKNRKEIP